MDDTINRFLMILNFLVFWSVVYNFTKLGVVLLLFGIRKENKNKNKNKNKDKK
jgi:hypothetical protein